MKPKKRLFLGLSLFLFGIIFLLLLLLAYYLRSPEEPIFRFPIIVAFVCLMLLALAVLASLGIIIFILIAGNSISVLNRIVEKVVVFIFPFILHLGKFLHITQDKVQRSFIEINNGLLEARRLKVLPHELLILLPHCLQKDTCPHKITRDPFNCHRCGNCPIHELLSLVEEWGVKVRVVTGGTLARKAVEVLKPRCILAVACERDLTSGIIDSFPLPVWGLLNERPYGPCFNTFVSSEDVEKALQRLVKRRYVNVSV
ncbi:MAG: DUF116 domain-containing protein [Firmicutes bacterium]|nr:DUF116 domain-containing protein [Bacillota bacterium]